MTINISVLSEINRTIEIIPITSMSIQNTLFSNQYTNNITYSNYIIKLGTIHTNFSNNSFIAVKNSMIGDFTNLFILFTMLICIYFFIGYLKKL